MRNGAGAELYDVAIVGGGVSGTALLFVLSAYTNIKRILLIEKEQDFGQINSRSNNNSQTLHIGEIETNYSIEKVRQVSGGASMVARYAGRLPEAERDQILFPLQKLVLAVGEKEVEFLKKRYASLKEIFPRLAMLDRAGIEAAEPSVARGRRPDEPILALRNDGHAVDYEMLARSLAKNAAREAGSRTGVLLNTKVRDLRRNDDLWELDLDTERYEVTPHSIGSTPEVSPRVIRARVIVFDADAYSLLFAKRLGYGHEYSLIPVAGTFFFSPELLRGKVYTVQDPRLPFSAVHGDPDVRVPGRTRWGPTARFFPVLESRKWSTAVDYFKVSGLHRLRTWWSFIIILLDPLRAWYLFRNVFYEIPWLGTYFFVRQVRKIVPAARARDFTRARGFGGMRLQRVNTNTHELLLGEGKIIGQNIIFNMTPSPGASVCLYNAVRDTEKLMEFFGTEFTFDSKLMKSELCAGAKLPLEDPSLRESYPS